MSATTSAATGPLFRHPAGCVRSGSARARRSTRGGRRAHHHRLGAGPARRGPVPRQSDAQLLAVIRADLARSPFHGEGHRKVHAPASDPGRIRVARTRVLRVMRAHGLLSPHRGRQGAAKTHDGKGHHPGAQRDVGDGRRAGIHARRRVGLDLRGGRTLERGVRGVARVQSREPLRGTRSDCARARTSLWFARRRCRPRTGASDGSRQSVSIRPLPQADPVLGIHPSFGFVEEPETNGVAERWNRTLKEQAITAESFRTSRPSASRGRLRGAVQPDLASRELGYHTPIEAREEYELRQAA